MVGDEENYDPFTQDAFDEVERLSRKQENDRKAEKTWNKRLAFRDPAYQYPRVVERYSGPSLEGFFESFERVRAQSRGPVYNEK